MGKPIKGDFNSIFKKYLGNWDLPMDGSDQVFTIKKIESDEVRDKGGETNEQPLIYFEEFAKPLICNQTNNKRLKKLLGPRVSETSWYGEKIYLRREPNAQSDDGYCVRVNPNALPKVETAFCEDCGQEIKAHGNYSVNKIVTLSKEKYGQALCWDCSTKRKEAE